MKNAKSGVGVKSASAKCRPNQAGITGWKVASSSHTKTFLSGKQAIYGYASHALGWMPRRLKIGFRFTHTLKGRRIADLHVIADDVPRMVVHRVPQPAVSVLHTSLLNDREEAGWVGFQAFFSLPMMLEAWFSSKALSASSGLPNLAQIA